MSVLIKLLNIKYISTSVLAKNVIFINKKILTLYLDILSYTIRDFRIFIIKCFIRYCRTNMSFNKHFIEIKGCFF